MNSALIGFLALVLIMGTAAYLSIKNDASSTTSPYSPLPDEESPLLKPVAVYSTPERPAVSPNSTLVLAPGWYPNADGTLEVYFDGEAWGESRPRQAEAR